MSMNIVLTKRDFEYFNDIMRFGFTTTEHYALRFGTTLTQARKRLCKLVNNKYLKRMGVSSITLRKIYIPDHGFYKLVKYRDTYKINTHQLEHDEYVLKIFSILKRKNLGKIKIEQDYKVMGEHKKYHKLPDFILFTDGGNFIFEYEKSQKSHELYQHMISAYKSYDPLQNYFVFICETDDIVRGIASQSNFKYVSFLKPAEFLKEFSTKTFDRLVNYFNLDDVTYFPKKKEITRNLEGASWEQQGSMGVA